MGFRGPQGVRSFLGSAFLAVLGNSSGVLERLREFQESFRKSQKNVGCGTVSGGPRRS